MTCELDPATDRRFSGLMTDPEPARRPTVEDRRREFHSWNAEQPNPLPVCRHCHVPFQADDSDIFDGRLCSGCGWARTERRVMRLLHARGKKARKRALRRLLSIAK